MATAASSNDTNAVPDVGIHAAPADDAHARRAYLEILRADPTHCGALIGLGALAHAGGFLSAARTAFGQAARYHPDSAPARVGYARMLDEAGQSAAARLHYEAALNINPDLPQAHQGLARILAEAGVDAAEHWRRGFVGHAVVRQRYCGSGSGIALLLLVAAVGGNVPVKPWIDDRIYAVTAIYADFFGPDDPLPPHTIVVNAIGDADLCGAALAGAERIVARSGAPVINRPTLVRPTGRKENARRLAEIPGLIAPRMTTLAEAATLGFPLLLRAQGYHTGQHFLRIETADALGSAAAALPGGEKLAIEYLDARGPDGLTRKYRVMFIGGTLYPLHLAISANWKVHYFTADMATNDVMRAEEQRFLNDMAGVLGPRAMRALVEVQAALGLDYAGIDFALAPDGRLILFEANATMAIIAPDRDPIWDYRRHAVDAALAAAQRLLPRGGMA